MQSQLSTLRVVYKKLLFLKVILLLLSTLRVVYKFTASNCSGVIALTPGVAFSSFPLTSTNLYATTTAGLTPSCQSSVSNDVWYSVVVPASGNITIEAQANGGLTDSVIVDYSGTCSTTLTPVGCNDNQGANLMSKLSLTGQTPGNRPNRTTL